mmetsp:Transcript_20806/g.57754  ORF Transcript_20806/g.57754 Transcript_20806/m.57754 type:complete len:96 (+) Transcript_20806:1076-1363(+)
MIRTSGETRLSDFLLLQSGFAMLVFTPVFWPDFSFFHFMKTIFQYQHSFVSMSAVRNTSKAAPHTANGDHDVPTLAAHGPEGTSMLALHRCCRQV